MSPAKLSNTLQEDFVKTELETGQKMLARAARQRSEGEQDAASESLSLARIALNGAEEHTAAVSLPEGAVQSIEKESEKLRRQITAFEKEAGLTTPPTA